MYKLFIFFILFFSCALNAQFLYPNSVEFWHLSEGTRDSLAVQTSVLDTVALKALTYPTDGSFVFLRTQNKGIYVQDDSTYLENGNGVYSNGTSGKQWIHIDLYSGNVLYTSNSVNGLSSMLAFIGTSDYYLVINNVMYINSNITIPSNIRLSAIDGGYIQSSGSNDTLTFWGRTNSYEFRQIFDTSLVVLFTDTINVPWVSLEMWGGAATNSLRDTSINAVAFERAINGHGYVGLKGRWNYYINSTIEGDAQSFSMVGVDQFKKNQAYPNVHTTETFSGDMLRNWSTANPTANRYISIRNIEFHANSDSVVDMLDLRHIYENSTLENLSFVIGENDTIQGAAFKHTTPSASSGNFLIRNINIPYLQNATGRLQRAIDITATAAVWIEGGNLFLDKCIDPTASIFVSASGSVVLDKINFESFSTRGGAAVYFNNCGNAVISNSYSSSRVDSATFVRVNHTGSPDFVTLRNVQLGVGNPGEQEFAWIVKYDDANYSAYTLYSTGYLNTELSGYVIKISQYATGGTIDLVKTGSGVQNQFSNILWRGNLKTLRTTGGITNTGGVMIANDLIYEGTAVRRITRTGAFWEEDWSAASAYVMGDYVRGASDSVYVAIADSGHLENPTADTDTTYWILVGDTVQSTTRALSDWIP